MTSNVNGVKYLKFFMAKIWREQNSQNLDAKLTLYTVPDRSWIQATAK